MCVCVIIYVNVYNVLFYFRTVESVVIDLPCLLFCQSSHTFGPKL